MTAPDVKRERTKREVERVQKQARDALRETEALANHLVDITDAIRDKDILSANQIADSMAANVRAIRRTVRKWRPGGKGRCPATCPDMCPNHEQLPLFTS